MTTFMSSQYCYVRGQHCLIHLNLQSYKSTLFFFWIYGVISRLFLEKCCCCTYTQIEKALEHVRTELPNHFHVDLGDENTCMRYENNHQPATCVELRLIQCDMIVCDTINGKSIIQVMLSNSAHPLHYFFYFLSWLCSFLPTFFERFLVIM